MSEPEKPIRAYAVGDVIRLRVRVQHEGNLDTVRVAYGLDGETDRTITFEGDFDEMEHIDTYARGERWLPRKISTATLVMAVDVDHTPGDYEVVGTSCRAGEFGMSGDLSMNYYEAGPPPFRIVDKMNHEHPLLEAVELLDEE